MKKYVVVTRRAGGDKYLKLFTGSDYGYPVMQLRYASLFDSEEEANDYVPDTHSWVMATEVSDS